MMSYAEHPWRSKETKKQYMQNAKIIDNMPINFINTRIETMALINLNTGKKALAATRHYLKWCKINHGENRIDSLMQEVHGTKKTIRSNSALSITERIKLIKYMANLVPGEKLLLEVLLTTGMRAQEFCDVDWIVVHTKKLFIIGKGNKERLVFLNDSVLNLLPIKTNYSYQKINRMLKKIEKDLFQNNRQFTAHTLRYSYATYLYNQGAAIEVISQLLGHEDVNTTVKYITFDSNKIESTNDLQYLKYEDSFDLDILRSQNKTLKLHCARLIRDNKELLEEVK